MKTSLCKKSLTVGMMALMLAAPVYAATPMDVSNPSAVDPYMMEVNQNKKNKKQKKNKEKVTVPVQQETESQASTQQQQVEQTGPRDERLIPYLGKTITKVTVTGNKIVPDANIGEVVKTNPGDKFTEEGLELDLVSIYNMGWFSDVVPSFEVVPEGIQVTYHVIENPKYERVEITGNTVFDKAKVEKHFKDLQPSSIANIVEINRCVAKLQEEYRNEGYIMARPSVVNMTEDGVLQIKISEGTVEGFKVKGNKKCKDYVITREMRLKVGKPFNAKEAKRSYDRLMNLQYFDDVDIKLNPGKEPNSCEVEIKVVERNTGVFTIGAGYSSADGFIGMIGVGDRNFRGTGDSINIKWEFGGEDNKNYDFTYVKPWLDHKETRLRLNLYNITNEYADYNEDGDEIARYDKRRTGQEVTLSRKAGKKDFITNYITLKNRKDTYRGEADDYENDPNQYYEKQFDKANNHTGNWRDWYPATAAERLKENFGTTRSITIGRLYDSRDNYNNPHAGKRIDYSFEWAGLGGDFDFRKLSADWRYYYRAGKKNPVNTWAWNLAAGYASGDMPLSQRFAMGGTDTLRGYRDDQFRGNSMLKATLEYRFPIVKRIEGVVFTDSGYAWDKRHESNFELGKIKGSAGVGIRINSPLGPLKFDYGRGSNGGRFHFSFGGQF